MRIAIERWGAWAPGLETRDQWIQWASSPSEIADEGTPPLPWVAPRLRRRYSRLSRIALQAAFSCLPVESSNDPLTVFASRHGEIDTTMSLLQDLTQGTLLSAHGFSHSVHNTAAGHFTIMAGNHSPSTSVAAGAATFECGFLEAMIRLLHFKSRPVLFVAADVPLPEPLDRFCTPREIPYGVALLLTTATAQGTTVDFCCRPSADQSVSSPTVPHALEFLRWLLADHAHLTLTAEEQEWTWAKTTGTALPAD